MARGDLGVVSVFVEDVARTREFYDRVFGRRVVNEDPESVLYDFGGVWLNLVVVSSAGELVEPADVATSGSRFLFTIFVDDVDGEVARLGLPLLNGPQDRPWGVRTAAFADPDGHVWELAQELPGSG